jgi:hypothetical protein
MPTYTFTDSNTGEQHEEFMGISEMEKYLEENPHMVLGISAPLIHSGRGMQKPDASFRDLLKHIKKGNQKGISRSTINTF